MAEFENVYVDQPDKNLAIADAMNAADGATKEVVQKFKERVKKANAARKENPFIRHVHMYERLILKRNKNGTLSKTVMAYEFAIKNPNVMREAIPSILGCSTAQAYNGVYLAHKLKEAVSLGDFTPDGQPTESGWAVIREHREIQKLDRKKWKEANKKTLKEREDMKEGYNTNHSVQLELI